jgi:nucleotide-binding universal stress UspA family protein
MSTSTILCATDFSVPAAHALELARTLARATRARLVVLHVAQPPVVMYDAAGRMLPPPGDYRPAARERLRQLQAAAGGVMSETRLADGEVAATILRTLEDVKPDLVVLGTAGRTGLDRCIVGSIAADVMRNAPCAVAVAHVPRGSGEGAAMNPAGDAAGTPHPVTVSLACAPGFIPRLPGS